MRTRGSACGLVLCFGRRIFIVNIADSPWRTFLLGLASCQVLLDRGWRRSGAFVYRPVMGRTCCTPYTIRLPALRFEPSRNQRKALRRLEKALREGLERGGGGASGSGTGGDDAKKQHHRSQKPASDGGAQLAAALDAAVTALVARGELPSGVAYPRCTARQTPAAASSVCAAGAAWSSPSAHAVAAAARRSGGACGPQTAKGDMQADAQRVAAGLRDELVRTGAFDAGTVEARAGFLNFGAIPVVAGAAEADMVVEEACSAAAQSAASTAAVIDTRSDGAQGVGDATNGAPSSAPLELVVTTAQSSFVEEEYALYVRYQMAVHDSDEEEISRKSYKRFLVDTPLTYVEPNKTSATSTPSCGFGSFHQQYRVGGRLVAVGVVDVLPNCLSSKYLFWDPDLAHLSLGKISALKEIEWVAREAATCPSMRYYYLGYYIPTCPKRAYKGDYAPSELLCPATGHWVSMERARSLMLEPGGDPLWLERAIPRGSALDEAGEDFDGSSSEDSDAEEEEEEAGDPMDSAGGAIEGDEANGDAGVSADSCIDGGSVDVGVNVGAADGSADSAENIRLPQREQGPPADLDSTVLLLQGTLLHFDVLRCSTSIPSRIAWSLHRRLRRWHAEVGETLAQRMAYVLTG